MLSLPDFKEKQILIVNADWGSKPSLKFLNDNIVFSKDDKIINRASCHKVFAVFVAGDIRLTSKLLQEGQKHGISLFLAKPNFEVYASILSEAAGNYLLRKKQYELTDTQDLEIAKKIIKNKIENQLILLKTAGKVINLEEIQGEIFNQIDSAQDYKVLLGIEGNVSKDFYRGYFKDIGWWRRSPRTKQDIPNFLLDIGYTFLFNLIDGLLSIHGFDTYKGFYHKLFFQRKSLACDIMEPFRCLIDKQALKSYHLKQINPKDFKIKDRKYTLDFSMNAKYAQLFTEILMDHKEDIFNYVRDFYRFMMDNSKPFPVFNLKIK